MIARGTARLARGYQNQSIPCHASNLTASAGASAYISKPMDLLKVWSVSAGLPLRERAKQRQAYRHQELRRWREFLGIPTYVFEGELFWGQDRLQMLEWRLTQKLGSPKGAPPKG